MTIRFAALIFALVLYGALGSPTPDRPGMVEAAVGALLIFAAGPDIARRIPACFSLHAPGWALAGWAFFLYAVTVPVAVALMHDRTIGNILRDFVFLIFFLIPLWLGPLIQARANGKIWLRALLLWIGIAFSVRTILPGLNAKLPGVDLSGPLYLAVAPSVLFAAFYLAGRTFDRAARGGLRPDSLVKIGISGALACAPFLALVLTLQRISLVALAACLIVWSVLLIVRTPRRAVLPALMIGLALFFGAGALGALIEAITLKTALVGVNSRFGEALIAIDSLSENFGTALLGLGWGATIPSPATAGVPVNFTHSLVTLLWMKTGLVGLALAGFYVTGIAARLVRGLRSDPVLALALTFPIAIDLFLYASYKSLDFGLVLLAASVFQDDALRTARRYKIPRTREPTNVVRA